MNSYTLCSFPREGGGGKGGRKLEDPQFLPPTKGAFFGGGGESSGRRKKKRHFFPRRHTFCCVHRDKVSLLHRGGWRPKIPTFFPRYGTICGFQQKADLIATVPHRNPQLSKSDCWVFPPQAQHQNPQEKAQNYFCHLLLAHT